MESEMHQTWEFQRTVHGHVSTLTEMKLNHPRNAKKGVHNFLGIEDRRYLSRNNQDGMLPRCQSRQSPLTLLRAIEFGDVSTVESKLASGESSNVNGSGGDSLLHVAVLHQQHRIVQLLLEYNAQVNARTHIETIPPFQNHIPMLYKASTASRGATPLHYACAVSNLQLVKTLLAAGAQTEIGASELCGTPLMWALCAEKDALEIVRLLLSHGASPHCRDLENNSMIAMAVLWWHEIEYSSQLYKLVVEFVSAGVDIQHKNTCGWTAYDVAKSESIKSMLERKFHAKSGRCQDIERFGNLERERDELQPWLKHLSIQRTRIENSS